MAYHGSCYWVATAGTTTVANTPTKALGTTAGEECNGFYHDASNKLVATVDMGPCKVRFTFSMSSSGATQSRVHIAKNGNVISSSEIQRKIGTGGDVGAGASSCLTSLKKDDYIEAYVETDDGDTLTVQYGNLSVEQL